MMSFLRKSAETRARADSLTRNIWTHDVAERLKIRRISIAKDQGLEEGYDVGTYPVGPVGDINIGNNSPPVGGLLKGALLAGSMLAGGAGIGAIAMNLLADKAKTEVIESVIDYGVTSRVLPDDPSDNKPSTLPE